METDQILFLECFTQVVDCLQAEHRRILGIDASVRGTARMSGLAFISDRFCHASVGAVMAGEVIRFTFTGRCAMYHHGKIDAVEDASVHELDLAAHVADHALLSQILTECQLDHFFSRYRDQTDRSAESFKSSRFLQRSRNAQQRSSLAVMAAAVRHAVDGFRMVRNIQRIQLTEDRKRRSGSACCDICVEARNVSESLDLSGKNKLITQFLEFLNKVIMCLPFREACLRMCPEPALCIQDQLFVCVDISDDQFLFFIHRKNLTIVTIIPSGIFDPGCAVHFFLTENMFCTFLFQFFQSVPCCTENKKCHMMIYSPERNITVI